MAAHSGLMARRTVLEEGRSCGNGEVERKGVIEVDISNPDRLMFPRDGYTKADLVDHYRRMAPLMLPLIRDRPVTMMRYPRGIDLKGFFQKNAPRGAPSWLRTEKLPKRDGFVEHVVCEKAADLIYLANIGCITPHVWLSRVDRPHHPDRLIIDLDPGSNDFQLVKETAILARRLLSEDGLNSFVMTTGSRGLHIVAPLDRSADFEAVRSYVQQVAEEMVETDPRLTTERLVEEREGRLLVDVFRNSYAQTAVAPYAVRARDGAPVATPLRWEELDDPELGPRSFTMSSIWKRTGDPWEGFENGGELPLDR